MALKDFWVDLKDGDDVSAEPINRIAREVIKLEDEGLPDTPSIVIDNEMSDTSENPVQNKVVKEYIDSEIEAAIITTLSTEV